MEKPPPEKPSSGLAVTRAAAELAITTEFWLTSCLLLWGYFPNIFCRFFNSLSSDNYFEIEHFQIPIFSGEIKPPPELEDHRWKVLYKRYFVINHPGMRIEIYLPFLDTSIRTNGQVPRTEIHPLKLFKRGKLGIDHWAPRLLKKVFTPSSYEIEPTFFQLQGEKRGAWRKRYLPSIQTLAFDLIYVHWWIWVSKIKQGD